METTPIRMPPSRYAFGSDSLKRGLVYHVAQNNVLSRIAIDMIGYDPWLIFLARNRYERYERLFDVGTRLSIAIALPVVLGKAISKPLNALLRRQFQLPQTVNPLDVPFEQLAQGGLNPDALRVALEKTGADATHQASLKPLASFQSHAAKLARAILLGKLLIMGVDQICMASKVQIATWGKNYMTARLKGEEGFSGTMGYASPEYQKRESRAYQEQKNHRLKLSLIIGYLGNLLLPSLLTGVLMSRKSAGPKGSTLAKKLAQPFNYHNVVYMSKWQMLWHMALNMLTAGALASRSRDELRETLVRGGAVMFFMTAGDDVISGLVSRWHEKNYQKQLNAFPLTRRGPFGLTLARPFYELASMVKNPNIEGIVRHAATSSLFAGIIGSGVLLGCSTNLLNNIYTRRKVRQEEALRQASRPIVPGHLVAPAKTFDAFLDTVVQKRLHTQL